MTSSGRAGAVLVLALALASCRTAPSPGPGDAPEGAAFPGADGVLAGFDPAEVGAAWRAKDRVLFALSTQSGARTHRKLVEIELLGRSQVRSTSEGAPLRLETLVMDATIGERNLRWSSLLLCVAVRVYEADGRLVQSTEAKVPETALRRGIHPALVKVAEWSALAEVPGDAQQAELTEQDHQVLCDAISMLPTLLGILQDDSVLESLLVQVVGRPSLLSLLRGVRVNVACAFDDARAAAAPASSPSGVGSVYRVPLRLAVNGEPSLDLELDVAAPHPPLRLAGGILSLRGVSCRGSERRVTFELIAARRGPPGAELRL